MTLQHVQIFDGELALFQGLADTLNPILLKASENKDALSMAVSGGSLPRLLASALTRIQPLPHPVTLHIVLADERLVPLTDPDSNIFAIQTAFTKELSQRSSSDIRPVYYPVNESLLSKGEECALHYAETLIHLEKVLKRPLHFVFLGMGPDGHTCSLFPQHLLLKSIKSVAFIHDSPKPPPNRITLTVPVLNRAMERIWIVTGAAKAKVIQASIRALQNGERNEEYPASLLNGETKWFLDRDAASLL